MEPIPSTVFYGAPIMASQAVEAVLDPALFLNSTNAQHPPTLTPSLNGSAAAPAGTPNLSSNTGLSTTGSHIKHKSFMQVV